MTDRDEIARLRAQVADVGWAGDWFDFDGDARALAAGAWRHR